MKKERYSKFAVNKKARKEFEILEVFEAGIELNGLEVKSIRNAKVNINDAFAKIKNSEIFIVNMHISEYENKGYVEHNPLRDKKLLMHKREILKISSKILEKGLTLVVLSLYPKNKLIKAEVALVRGKKIYDKREDLKNKAIKRDMERVSK